MGGRTFVLYVAAYAARADADLDYEIVGRFYSGGAIAIYDATLLDKDHHRRPFVIKTLAGLFFPPCLMHQALADDGVDPAETRLWRGLSTDDLKALAAVFDEGAAWLMVIAGAGIQKVLKDPGRAVVREFERPVAVDDSSWISAARSHGLS